MGANDINASAQMLVDDAKERLENERDMAAKELERLGELKLQIWDGDMARFVKTFNKIKNIEFKDGRDMGTLGPLVVTKGELSEIKNISLHAGTLLAGGAGAVGSGVLMGVASYGGVVTFGAASTGAAISGLSGVAATNATLAWLGGGSLAAGGYGMAGGMLVLGGLVAGPALLVGGFIFSAAARSKLAQANANYAEAKKAAEEMDIAAVAVRGIGQLAQQFSEAITAFQLRFARAIDALDELTKMRWQVASQNEGYDVTHEDDGKKTNVLQLIKTALLGALRVFPFHIPEGQDYSKYSREQREFVWFVVESAHVMKALLETPLLDEAGGMNTEATRTLALPEMLAANSDVER
jgi:hypothetical protein